MVRYINETLIKVLQSLAKDLGRTPMMKDLTSEENFPECTVFKDRFGSWNNALRTAGLEIKYQFRKWTKEEVIK